MRYLYDSFNLSGSFDMVCYMFIFILEIYPTSFVNTIYHSPLTCVENACAVSEFCVLCAVSEFCVLRCVQVTFKTLISFAYNVPIARIALISPITFIALHSTYSAHSTSSSAATGPGLAGHPPGFECYYCCLYYQQYLH